MSDTSGTEGPPPYPEAGQPPTPGQGQPSVPPGYPPPNTGQPGFPPPQSSSQPGYPGYPGQPPGPPPNPYGAPPANYPPGQPYAGGSGYPGYPGGYGDQEYGKTGRSGLAIAAFVVGLVVPLLGLFIAVPLGIVALVKIGKTHQKGKALAIAGIVLSVLWWVGIIALAAFVESQQADRDDSGQIVKAGTLAFGDVREGDCLSLPDINGSADVDANDVQGVPCGDPHNSETVAVIPINGEDYPGETALDEQSATECEQSVDAATSSNPEFVSLRIRPVEAVWDDDNGHRVLCFAVRGDGADFTGPVSDQ